MKKGFVLKKYESFFVVLKKFTYGNIDFNMLYWYNFCEYVVISKYYETKKKKSSQNKNEEIDKK